MYWDTMEKNENYGKTMEKGRKTSRVEMHRAQLAQR